MLEKRGLPLWFKIFLLFAMLSVVFTILGAISEFLIPVVLLVALMIFPGRDPEVPLLAKVIPYIWGVEILLSIVMLIAHLTGRNLMPEGARPPTLVEMIITLATTPILIWAVGTRPKQLRPILMASAVLAFGVSLWVYFRGPRGGKDQLELASSLVTQTMLAGYLLLKLKPRKSE